MNRLEHVHCLETINNMSEEKVSMRGRKRTLTDSERKRNRSAVSSKWNKCRIYVGDQLDRWNELKEVLRVQTHAEVAKILLDMQLEHVAFFSQSFFIFYEFMMMPMIIFGRYSLDKIGSQIAFFLNL